MFADEGAFASENGGEDSRGMRKSGVMLNQDPDLPTHPLRCRCRIVDDEEALPTIAYTPSISSLDSQSANQQSVLKYLLEVTYHVRVFLTSKALLQQPFLEESVLTPQPNERCRMQMAFCIPT